MMHAGRLNKAQEIAALIREAFSGVRLGNGIGLREAHGLDDHEDAQACATYRANDEKDDWSRISIDELNACYSSLSFFDAAGMRFHLPAFLIADLNGGYLQDMSFQLAFLNDYSIAQYALLSPAQRKAVSAYLQFMLEDESGRILSSHATSYHARFVDTPAMYTLSKPAGSTLVIDVERRCSRVVIAGAHGPARFADKWEPARRETGRGRSLEQLLRQNDGVDDVDHAVGRNDVGLDDLGVVDRDGAVHGVDRQRLTLHGLDLSSVDLRGHDFAWYDVVGQDGGELLLIHQQCFERARRQLGERFVGRREYREWALALQRVDQTGFLHRLDQRLELAGGDRRVHDVGGKCDRSGGCKRGRGDKTGE
jgi:hypothetical protein